MLKQPASFWHLFGADFILRTAYQMGKTPVLPLFAAAIGAGQMLIGSIVAVSTVTGMLLKPLIGALSDRWGRRLWLWLAVALFAGTPFLYQLVTTPDELFLLRLFHGTATAIFGPVTLAYIIEMGREERATRLGWFEMARSGGYFFAPAITGWLLTILPPEQVFTIIGLLSCLAFVPIAFMKHGTTPLQAQRGQRPSLWRQFASGFGHTASRIELWFASSLEVTVYCVTYGLKAFLPIFAVQEAGFSVLAAGLFFTVQEAAHMLTRPVGGRLGDRSGYLPAISGGMVVMGAALLLLPATTTGAELVAVAVLSGIAQGLIFPSTVALVGNAVSASHTGLGLGVYGTMKNLGKVIGPVATGGLLELFSYGTVFRTLAGFILTAALLVLLTHRQRQRAYE